MSWKFLTQSSDCCIKQWQDEYGPPENFFSWKPNNLISGFESVSYVIRIFLKQEIRWKASDGQRTKFWLDN